MRTDRGLILEHNPGPEHGVVKLRMVALVPDRRVEWEFIGTHPPTSPALAWTGTHVVFDVAADGQAVPRPGSTGRDDGRVPPDRLRRPERVLRRQRRRLGCVLANLKRVLESAGR